MRNMSFMLTTPQVRAGTKTVTRRDGWWFLQPGDRIMACVKCQGLGKGGKIERIREIEIVSTEAQRLDKLEDADGTDLQWRRDEMTKEGFPGMHPSDFITMFIKHHKGTSSASIINRIEFKYV